MSSDPTLQSVRDEVQITSQTFRYEKLRAISSGIVESAAATFLLFIAVTWYRAEPLAKSILAAGTSSGLLLSPLAVYLTARFQWPGALAGSRLLALSCLAMLGATVIPSQTAFVVGSTLALLFSSSTVPLLTQIYQENYPTATRGKLFSRTVMIRIASAAITSGIGGWALKHRIENFHGLLGLFALALGFASWCLKHCPSTPLPYEAGSHPLSGLRHLKTDALFRTALISWMLMGFANLMMLPLRIEYLANPKYGMALDAAQVAMLTGVIPHAARFIMSPVWGWLFDRMNFFALRITLNLGFALGILGFFTTTSPTGLVLAAVIYGVSNAGGDVAWSLWVTRFAPPAQVAEYMSVHTFATGIRGVVAPAAAFYLINQYSTGALALGCASLILLASALLLPEIRSLRVAGRGRPR